MRPAPCSATTRRCSRAHRAERAGAHARDADVELVQHERGALPADREHEREGPRLHHRRRRSGGRLQRDRQPAEDPGDRLDRAGCSSASASRAYGDHEHHRRARARREPVRRGRADALRGARRLPLPVREREARRRRGGPRAAEPVPRARSRRARRVGRTSSRVFSRSRSSSGCSPRSRSTSARSSSIGRAALQLPVVQRTEWAGR
jgi:hypothetical protein